ncbi:MAG: AzlD domain-containing protein [Anaerolineae bacterium]|nr:AzlD domain-containing protein [Anaerolineae bacterium]
MNDWLIILGMALVTYPVRLSVIALLGENALPEGLNRALRYVPPAALAAIIFPELLMPGGGGLNISPTNFRLVAGLVAALVAWRTKRTLLSIGMGMALLWLLQLL